MKKLILAFILFTLLAGCSRAPVTTTPDLTPWATSTPTVDQLIGNLKTSYGVPNDALQALATVGAPAFDPLVAALKDKNYWAAEALVPFGSRAVEPLLPYLKSDDFQMRLAVIGALAEIKDPRAVEPLIPALTDPEFSIQKQAISALGEIGDRRAVEPLLVHVLDGAIYPQMVITLGKLKDARAVEPLINAYGERDLVSFHDQFIETFVNIGSPSVEPLIAALYSSYSSVQDLAIDSLGELKDARAVDPLVELLRTNSIRFPLTIFEALGNIGSPAVDALGLLLQDQDPYIRRGAAQSFSMFKDTRSVELLIAAMQDEDPDVVMMVEYALGKNQDGRADEELLARLQDVNQGIRMEAASALGEIADEPAVERLTTAFEKRELEIIAGAHNYFIRKGEAGTEPVLIDALSSYGNTGIATDFMNCNNGLLSAAGNKWATDHHAVVIYGAGSSGPTWGSGQ